MRGFARAVRTNREKAGAPPRRMPGPSRTSAFAECHNPRRYRTRMPIPAVLRFLSQEIRMIAYFRRCVAVLLIVSLLLPFTAHAALVATEAALDHQRIGQLLERADVQRELRARGVDLAQARERAAALTDAEAAQIVSNIDQLPAGGVGIIGAILIVFLVLLLTDILGYTKVFPFTKPMH